MLPAHDQHSRLTSHGSLWLWDNQPVPYPVPRNSAVSLAIAQRCQEAVLTAHDRRILDDLGRQPTAR